MGLRDLGWEPSEVHDYAEIHAINQTRYVGWLNVWYTECTLRVWAYKRTKKYGLQIREVIRYSTKEEFAIIRDMYLTTMCGWKVFYRPSEAKCCNWYGYTYYDVTPEDFNKWEENKIPGVYYEIINLEALKNGYFDYCGFTHGEIITYLKLWKQHPCVEYFGKANICPSKAIIKQIEKDKAFGKWLSKQDIKELREALPQAILYAYKNNTDLETARKECYQKNVAIRYFVGYNAITRAGIDKVKAYKYLEDKGIGRSNYADYIEACVDLGLDMKDTKNAFPKDFRRMHDLRIDECASKKAKSKTKNFKKASEQYKRFESDGKTYCVVIPEKISDLIYEGSVLQHCVGKMGYDQKMIDGKSFIAFIRKADEKEKPFVTVEYDLRFNKIAQIYGYQDSRPAQEVIDYSKVWERRVKKEWTKSGLKIKRAQ